MSEDVKKEASKLGADMTYSQWILDVMGRYDFTMPQAAFDEIVRKLSARQPAAIDKDAVCWIDAETLRGFSNPQNGWRDRAVSIRRGESVFESDGPLYAAPLPREAATIRRDAIEQCALVVDALKAYTGLPLTADFVAARIRSLIAAPAAASNGEQAC